ncbi:hypothetical protein A3B45_04710 [Candidatus Daviesbacteria bacterium RIFCSPLOWO2_01_FULL_39_12]|uniref:Uncharacterized protein n=1 Tax=Candidatus Daviesbacteria bacterium RIFCSPLOWO2_01_FULL_39_12 TaxID=1797785 RepID=A0A1F5KLF9_9BACT|nr:MAG: hypothetical protein A3B45_04710 [Candidatus Daviesbacteria bacterium RIFCSPLOWO2_01_FULL_39_12]
MTENQRLEANTVRHSPNPDNNTMVLRIPKPNLQIIVLGLIAVITLFQTFQLVRISSQASSASVKAAPATTTNSGAGTGSNTDVPKSMVGGC